jgi:hypothetical protein
MGRVDARLVERLSDSHIFLDANRRAERRPPHHRLYRSHRSLHVRAGLGALVIRPVVAVGLCVALAVILLLLVGLPVTPS